MKTKQSEYDEGYAAGRDNERSAIANFLLTKSGECFKSGQDDQAKTWRALAEQIKRKEY